MNEQSSKYHHGNLRAALLNEAAAMIANDGVASVTMRTISARLGVSRSALYRHFPDRAALMVAVAAAGFQRLTNCLESIDAVAPRSSTERFRRMGEEYVRFALENPAHYGLMFGKDALTHQAVPELREAADALLALSVSVIRAPQRTGGIKRGDPKAQAYVAWIAVHGLASLVIEGHIDKGDVDKLIRQTTQTLLDGLRVRRRS